MLSPSPPDTQGKASTWVFVLSYAKLDEVLPLAHECLAASRLPPIERCVVGSEARPPRCL